MQLLLENGANVNARNISGESALFRAAKSGHSEVVECLLKGGAVVNPGESLLYVALLNGHEDVAKALLAAGANPALLLGVMVRHKRADFLHRLLALGMNPNDADENGFTLLMRAATGNAIEVAKILIERGADVNAQSKSGETALYRACAFDNPEIAEYLIRCGARPSVIEAVLLGNLELLRYLIAEGADVNLSVNSNSPLSAAVSRQRADIVELLLQNGAKVHVGSPSRTPMDLAVKNGGMTIIGLLLRALENE